MLTTHSGVYSITQEGQKSARFESAVRIQRQKAKLLERSKSTDYRFQQLAKKVQEDGIIPVIVTLRIAYSVQDEVNGDVESLVQRYEIGRVREQMIDELIGYDPSSVKKFDQLPIMAVNVNASGVESLRRSREVIDVQEDELSLPSLAESVRLIGGNTAWSSGFTGKNQTIAILDTGFDKNHPMLSGKFVSEACYSTTGTISQSICPGGVSSSTLPDSAINCTFTAACEHGTHVAGIAAGKTVTFGGQTFSGVAKDANIIPINVFSRINDNATCTSVNQPTPCLLTYISDIIKGLERVYALRTSYQIVAVNMSLSGGRYSSNCDSDSLKPIIDLLRAANIATVASSGNNRYTEQIGWPGCISTAVSVGATLDTTDTVASYSNSSSILSLLAPGSGIISAVPGNGYGSKDGTSMAAPHIAGAWALARQKSQLASVSTILNAIQSTGVPVTDSRNGITKPRVAIDRALAVLTVAPPARPTNLIATAISTRIDLTWNDNSNDETGFVLERKTGTTGTWTTVAFPVANATSHQDTSVAESTTYFYRLSAVNGTLSSVSSNEVSATSLSRITAPTSFTVKAFSTSRIDLSWVDTTTSETGYRVSRRLTSGTVWTDLTTLAANTSKYSDLGLTTSTSYTYRVSAIASDGRLVSSPEVSGTTYGPTLAPTNVGAQGAAESLIYVWWTDVATNEQYYIIEYSESNKTNWKSIISDADSSGRGNRYIDSLNPDTQYTIRVSAVAPGGLKVSAPDVVTKTPKARLRPLNVTTTAVSETEIKLSWEQNPAVNTGYLIHRQTGNIITSNAIEVARLLPDARSFTDKNLTPATRYTYSITVIGDDFVSVSETTRGPSVAPTKFSGTAISSSQIKLTWDDNSTNETGYLIQRRLYGTIPWTDLIILPANTTSYIDRDLKPETSYAYLIHSIAPDNVRIRGLDIVTKTLTVAPPARPTNLIATAISTRIDLTWNDNSNDETGFVLERKTGTTGTWTTVAFPVANATSHQDTSVAESTTYFYRLSAVNGTLSSVSSNEVSATSLSRITAPTSFTVKAFSTSRIDLSWVDTTTSETGYRVSRRLTSGTVWTDLTTLAANTSKYSDLGLTTSTSYTYRVSAIASDGRLVSSPEVSGTTYGPTLAPTNVGAQGAAESLIYVWWTDVATNEQYYIIEYSESNKTNWKSIISDADSSGRGNRYIDSLNPDTQYTIRVSAVAPGGLKVSAPDVVTKTPKARLRPLNVTTTAVSETEIKLSWEQNPAVNTGYLIHRQTGNIITSNAIEVARLLPDARSFTDKNLTPATRYTYSITVIGDDFVSVSETTRGPSVAPTKFSGTAISSSQIKLTWDDNSTNETGYLIQRRLYGTIPWTDLIILPANTTSYIDRDLKPETSYAYLIHSIAPDNVRIRGLDIVTKTLK